MKTIPDKKRALQDLSNSRSAPDEDRWEPVAADDARALIPDGDYDVLCIRSERLRYQVYHRFSIVLSLQVCDGEYGGTLVERYYNVPMDGKMKRGGDYYREWILANQGKKPHRRERMPKKKFVGKIFRARVSTVSTNHKGLELGPAAYSKVARLLQLMVTNERVDDL